MPSLSQCPSVEPSHFDSGLALGLTSANRIIGKMEANRGLKSACPLGFSSCCPRDPGHHCQAKEAGQTSWMERCDQDTSVAAGSRELLARHAKEAILDHRASASPPADHSCMSPAETVHLAPRFVNLSLSQDLSFKPTHGGAVCYIIKLTDNKI